MPEIEIGGRVHEVDDIQKADIAKLWMTDIAERIATEITAVRGYPVVVEVGSGPIVWVTLAGAEGDVSAGRELKELLGPILRDELDRESERLEYRLSSYNKDDDLLCMCKVIVP